MIKRKIQRTISYKSSGVDIKKAEKLISNLKPLIESTYNKAIQKNFGGFSSILDIKKLGYVDPLLLSTTDGVGTKLQLAIETNDLANIGIDLVAMCANDIIAQGGKPHFFMDYIATGKINLSQMTTVIKSIINGCKLADCALVGGETAEMPGHYYNSNFDLAGFCIGAAERNRIFNITKVKKGNLVIAVESNGLHSNGFSLIRKLIKDRSINLNNPAPYNSEIILKKDLLKPTFIYTNLFKEIDKNIKINGITHVTGGGLIENPPRSFSKHLKITINMNSFIHSDLYKWIKEEAKLSWKELLNTFNFGIGLLIYIEKTDVDNFFKQTKQSGFKSWVVGEVLDNDHEENVKFIGLDN